MSANKDFKELFKTFNEERVEYLVVGAHAVIFYSEPRYTKDLDIWINPTIENAKKLWKALERFGAPLSDISLSDFTDAELIYQIGIAPNRIDILMGISQLVFNDAIKNCTPSTYDTIPVKILGKYDLIATKKATARDQDLLDVKRLEK